MLAREASREALLGGPFGPAIAAANAGERIPALPPEARDWMWEGIGGFQVAAWINCPRLALELIGMGADVSTPVDGDSPLLAAAMAGAWEIVDLLLEAGADPMALSSPTSLLDLAVTADSESALGAVLEALEPGDLGGGIGTRAMAGLLGADGLDGRESRVDALIDAGVKPDVWNLLAAAEVVATDAIFERVYAAVEAGLANGDSSFDWGVVCSFDLNADDISLAYRVDDLERIVSLAVTLDKC